uniref:Peptidase S8 and S53 subtilisin kexin sedolisin n=1 Tax=uncultured organism TaxID=155900 RepID=M1Q2I8_9ZZZZ|nr:peptidase S8 and S53 subtilisin kexin sedolisin [uncultured organism]
MKKVKNIEKSQPNKLLIVLLVTIISVSSFGIIIGPQIAGGAGDSSVSPASSTASSTRWGLSAIKAKRAWNVTKGSDEVTVAVIDSGVDRSIPSLRRNIWKNEDEIPGNGIDDDNNGYVDDVSGWDFRERDSLNDSYSDLHYHGTFVAGLVASSYNRETGSGGVAQKVSLMDLRFLNREGQFYRSDWNKLADAIDYAVDNGADIINMSLYANIKPPESVHSAIRRAETRGTLVVGIAGNNGSSVRYFGNWEETFTVGAVNKKKRRAYFSNYGSAVEIMAPGQSVLSYRPGGATATASGTSFAAPHVAGTAALILSQNPNMSLNELKNVLRNSARDIAGPGKDDKTGYGILDTESGLNAITGQARKAEEGNTKESKYLLTGGNNYNQSPFKGHDQ